MKIDRPKKWQNEPLEQLLEFVTGGDWGKDPSFNDPDFDLAYCIRGSEIKNWEAEKGQTASLRKIKKSSIATRKLKAGDILVEISGGGPEQPVGRTVLIDKTVLNFESQVPKICTNFLRLIRPIKGINSKYLNLYLKLFYYSGDIVNYQAGSNNLRNLKFPDFIKIQIPYPSAPEQEAIVSKIEELFSELDKGIENLLIAQQQLKIYRQSVLKWAFEGKLTNKNVKEGELPKRWKREKLGEICNIRRGKSRHRPRNEPSLYGGNYPFIQTGDIRDANGGYIFSYSQTYSEKGLQQSKLWKKGTLCITIAANIGETAILGIDACFPDSVVGLVSDENILLNKYTNYFFISFKSKLDELAPATAQKNINVEILEKVEIPLPPIEEQQIIIEAIENRLSVADKLEESISQSLQQAEALRQSILKKAFEGKLVKLNVPASTPVKATPKKSEAKSILLIPEEFPRIIPGIAATDLHAGVISMIIDAHEKSPDHLSKMNHVKCEKIVHLVENMIGISLGREPVKDAAGPDDYSHLKKVEHRANMAGYFKTQDLSVGHTYQSMRGMNKIIDKTKAALTEKEYKNVSDLINIFLKFDMEHAEVIATLYAGWNNLLIQGKTPTDDEVIKESREDWSSRKLTIDRQKFVKALAWMKQHNFIPEGKGKLVVKKEKKGKKAATKGRVGKIKIK